MRAASRLPHTLCARGCASVGNDGKSHARRRISPLASPIGGCKKESTTCGAFACEERGRTLWLSAMSELTAWVQANGWDTTCPLTASEGYVPARGGAATPPPPLTPPSQPSDIARVLYSSPAQRRHSLICHLSHAPTIKHSPRLHLTAQESPDVETRSHVSKRKLRLEIVHVGLGLEPSGFGVRDVQVQGFKPGV